MSFALVPLVLVAVFIAGVATLIEPRNQRVLARTCVRVASVMYRPRREEFTGELAVIQEVYAETGLEYAWNALVGASIERVTSAGRPLRIENVSKRFGSTQAVNGISLEIPAGSITALLGGNGAGKTTLIRMIDGAHAPDTGRIKFGDTELQARNARTGVHVIKQDGGLFDHLTVAQNLSFTTSTGHWMINTRAEVERARVALRAIGSGIDPTLTVESLSRTDRQIVSIARSVAGGAQVLVLDEPSAQLTRAGAQRLFHTLDIVRRRGLGLLFVSHRLDDVLELADRVAVMRDGDLVFEGIASDTDAESLVRHIVGESATEAA